MTESGLLNRELSWLDFNARVLHLAEDAARPVLERAKFLAIFSQNLDEFFQVRVSGLIEALAAGIHTPTPDGMEPGEQLDAIRERVAALVDRQSAAFAKEVAPALADAGLPIRTWDDLDDATRAGLRSTFEEKIFPVLTPLAVDPAHPFPYISSLSLNLAVMLRDPVSGSRGFARVKIPPLLPRFMALGSEEGLLPLEELVAGNLDRMFPGMEVVGHHPFRVTRDADFELADESEDLLEAMETVLRQRTRSGMPVRLEVDGNMTDEVLELLCRELDLGHRDVTVVDGLLDLSGLWGVHALDRPDLKDPPFTPQTPPELDRGEGPVDVFAVLDAGDQLVHHPYDSFEASLERFLAHAAADPDVLAIKQTLYRTSRDESSIVRSLTRAAESGKQVVALVELKARFDEEANIERARALEKAGAHVVYGVVGLKTHAKILLVVRRHGDSVRRYCHVGTGNYNAQTAAVYEDIGILSADADLGADLSDLFNYLTGYSRAGRFRKLLVAPLNLRDALTRRIDAQAAAGAGGRIVMKMNSLVDPAMIDSLYAASSAGTPVDLIVRGICCLRPGVPGLSENIRVRSLVGRYLEHSRVYRFGPDPQSAEYLIGSADLMPRNLDRRVEALAPVDDPRLRARLDEILRVELADDRLAWELGPDGTWRRVAPGSGIDAQARFEELARERAHGGREVERDAPARDVEVRAAGGIVWRPGRSGPEVLLVHRPRYDDWTFPKGKAEPGEPDRATALREVEEETGRVCRIDGDGPVAQTRYVDHHDRTKRVVYFLMRPVADDGRLPPPATPPADDRDPGALPEVDETRWLGVEAAAGVLTYPRDRPLLDHVPLR